MIQVIQAAQYLIQTGNNAGKPRQLIIQVIQSAHDSGNSGSSVSNTGR